MATTSLSQRHDRTRPDIIETFRKRINEKRRTKLFSDERGILALILRDRLIQMAQDGTDTPDAIQQLCLNEIRLLEEGYPRSTLNSSYLPEYTRLIKEAIAAGELLLTEQNAYDKQWVKQDGSDSGVERRHYALDYLTYDLRTQRELRNTTTERNNIRQDNLAVVELDQYMDAVQELVASNDPIELIIGIAAVTGRRHTEVVSLGQFGVTEDGNFNRLNLQEHPYLLRFAGQQKKAEPIIYDILTLIPAVDVLAAVNKLRGQPEIAALEGKPYDDPDIKAMVARVDRKVHALLGKPEIVPLVEGFQTVSIHRLRGLYGAIAIHYFCPTHQREHRFLQHYLGHVLEGEIQANSRATDHYFHYNLTRKGKVLTARGIKIPSAGLFPAMQDGFVPPEAEEADINAVEPIDEADQVDAPSPEIAITLEQTEHETEDNDMDRALIDTLQAIAKQQSQTIETQAATVSQLQQQNQALLEQAKTSSTPPASDNTKSPPPESNTKVIALEQTIAHQKERIVVLEQALKNAIADKNDFKQQLEKIRSIFNLPNEPDDSDDNGDAEGDEDTPEASPDKTASAKPTRGRTPGNPEKSITYRRAVRAWELTKQWNREHPTQAMQLSKSLLTREFGIHAKAIQTFFDNHSDDITAENERLGIGDGDMHFNKGDAKQKAYFQFVRPILKKEGLSRK